MKKTVFRGIRIAMLLGLVTGLVSWWLGLQVLASKPLAKPTRAAKDPVMAAFKGSGARFQELNFIGWAQINEKFLGEKELAAVARVLAGNFGSPDRFTLRVTRGQNWRQVQLETGANPTSKGAEPVSPGELPTSPGEKIRILVQTRAAGSQATPQTYYSVYISSSSLTGYSQLKAQAEASMEGVPQEDKNLSTVITGWYPGVLTAKGMRNIANKALALSGAKITEGVGEKNFLSISGYTPEIKNSVRILDHEVNFNVAVRANQVEKKTYLFIGSPLIAREY